MSISITVDVDVDDIASEIRNPREAIEFIRKLDKYYSAWDHSGALLSELMDAFHNDFVESKNPEGKLSDDEKETITKALSIIKREFKK